MFTIDSYIFNWNKLLLIHIRQTGCSNDLNSQHGFLGEHLLLLGQNLGFNSFHFEI